MITPILQPAEISLTKNPIVFQYRATDDNGDLYGTKNPAATVQMNSNGFAIGDTIILRWGDEDNGFENYTFTAVASPSAEGEIQAQPSGLPTFSYFELVASQMQSVPLVASLFTFQADTPSAGFFSITANQQFENGEVTWLINGISNANATATNTYQQEDNTPDGYAIVMELFFEGVSGFKKVVELKAIPDAQGLVTFNLEEILHAEFKNDFPFVPINTDTPVLANNIKKYFARIREDWYNIFENPLSTDGDWISIPTRQVLCGGVSQAYFADHNLLEDLDEENAFLSWYPDGKTVSPDQPEYIAWFNHTDTNREIIIRLERFRDTDQMTELFRYDDIQPKISVAPNQTLIIPVGYNQLDIDIPGNTDVRKYTIQVVDAASDFETGEPIFLSQKRSYYVDYCDYPEKRYIQFANGFCIPQTIRCIGRWTKDLLINREESTKILKPNYQSIDRQRIQHNVDFDNQFIYRTGWLTKNEVDALQEYLINNEGFEILASGYLPLHIISKRFAITQTLKNLHALEIKVIPGLKLKNYSNKNLLPKLTSEDFWELESSNGFWELESGGTFWELENA